MAETRIELTQQLQSSQDETVVVRKAFEREREQVERLSNQVQMLSCSADSASSVDSRNEVSVWLCGIFLFVRQEFRGGAVSYS